MSSKHALSCNECDFSVDIRSYRPFYLLNDGGKEYARTPIGYKARKHIDGYDNEVYCKNCNDSIILTYQYKPYTEPGIKILKIIKEAFFILRTIWGRRYKKPLPSCSYCEGRNFLSAEDTCPKCEEGEISKKLLWIS